MLLLTIALSLAPSTMPGTEWALTQYLQNKLLFLCISLTLWDRKSKILLASPV